MRVISTNTGKPQTYEFNGATVRSSIRRSPTLDGIEVKFDRVEGDKFAVAKYHGIKEAVVYAYSAATFPALAKLFAQEVDVGNVGENLTCTELLESEFMIGDEYEVGNVRLRVSGPRYPCNRLNFGFQRADAMDLFVTFRRPGVYFEVLREGHIAVGDTLTLVKSAGGRVSVLDLYDNLTTLKQVAAGRISPERAQSVCEAMVADRLIPSYIREKFEKVLINL
jgi:MOSC domain-containing protein YiiM